MALHNQLYTVILIILFNIYPFGSQFTEVDPIWVTSPYFRANNEPVINVLTGEREMLNMLDDTGSETHAIDILGKNKLGNGLNLDYVVRYNHTMAGFFNSAYNKIFNTDDMANNVRYIYADNPNNQVYTGYVQNAMFVDQSPDKIATSGYNDKEWIPATVPGTILGDYYNFGALPDPLYSDNMHQISDWFFSGNDFWYRTRVNFPTELSGKRIFINFSGINYKSEIYFKQKIYIFFFNKMKQFIWNYLITIKKKKN